MNWARKNACKISAGRRSPFGGDIAMQVNEISKHPDGHLILEPPIEVPAQHGSEVASHQSPQLTPMSPSSRRLWAIGVACAIAAVVALVAIMESTERRSAQHLAEFRMGSATAGLASPAPLSQPAKPGVVADAVADSFSTPMAAKAQSETQNGPVRQGPMIARAASLAIQVKDFGAARSSLDSIIARHDGYSANLTVDTPENGPRHFQASLRIPENELALALDDLKALGRTLNESQSGEEVTQQHTDLLARLKNSRETEARLSAILQQRTGKIEDVLLVEQEIARVRGEIESMEAAQRALEHRVTFASVDLQLVEEYKERFNPSPVSTTGRLHNAFISGMRNASGTVLGLILFLEEFGPPFLIWAAILGFPSYFAWRRYQKVRASA